MSNYSVSKRLRSRIISSIIMMAIFGVIFGIFFGATTAIFYGVSVLIYLAVMIPRYQKIKRAEEAAIKGDFSMGIPRINSAATKYSNMHGQPVSYIPPQQNVQGFKDSDMYSNETEKEICNNCGIELAFDAMFCEECGAKRH